jgi:Na+-translocating ferredoxin:NAD+ oxidoreductase RNF subunit RnfB
MSGLLLSIAILGGVGLVFGGLIAFANAKLRVWEDPRIDDVEKMLPSSNCGGCGYPGCRSFAEAVVSGVVQPAKCTVMNDEQRADVAAYLGVDAGAANKVVARLLCAGGNDVAPRKATYDGIASCAAAVAVSGGGKGCAWGCVGLADCAVACTFDAITMNERGLPVVDPAKCTACNDCVEACPLGLFTLMPMEHRLVVQCKSLLAGDAATAVCSVACNACGRCALDAPAGLVEMKNGLAVVDYAKWDGSDAAVAAISRCPTNAIVWLEGAQFAASAGASGVRRQATETAVRLDPMVV